MLIIKLVDDGERIREIRYSADRFKKGSKVTIIDNRIDNLKYKIIDFCELFLKINYEFITRN